MLLNLPILRRWLMQCQDKADIADYPLTEKIKKFQSYMTYIKVK